MMYHCVAASTLERQFASTLELRSRAHQSGGQKVTTKPEFFLVFSLLLSSAVVGQHAAHVHGEAHLSIAAAEGELYIEFESPAANMVGFEHPPQSQKEKLALEAAARKLAGADGLL